MTVCTCLSAGGLHAQAPTTAMAGLIKDAQVGITFTSAKTDEVQKRITGITGISAYAIVDFSRLAVPGTPGSYGLYALGGGHDIRLSRRPNLRAIDFEKQRWPNFPPNGLAPTLVSAGAAYRFH